MLDRKWSAVQSSVLERNAAGADECGWSAALGAASEAVDQRDDAVLVRQLSRDGHTDDLRAELRKVSTLSVNLLDDDGMTALHWACSKGHADCVRLLLTHGADIEQLERSDGATPLILATRLEHLVVARLLVDSHADVQATDKYGASALIWAARNGQPEAIELLLQATVRESDESLQSVDEEPLVQALRVALRNGSAECVCVVMKYLGELVLPSDLADIFDDEEQRRVGLRALLCAYSLLPNAALAKCVARAFKSYPCSALHGLIQLSAAAKSHAVKIRTRDYVTSESLRQGSDRLQLAVPAALGELNEQQEVNMLLRSVDGRAILPLAVRAECKTCLAQPTVQHFLTAEWLGPLLDEVVHRTISMRLYALRCAFTLLLLLPQLLLLPLVSIYPPLEPCLASITFNDLCLRTVAEGWLHLTTDRPYLLDVPIVKFALCQARAAPPPRADLGPTSARPRSAAASQLWCAAPAHAPRSLGRVGRCSTSSSRCASPSPSSRPRCSPDASCCGSSSDGCSPPSCRRCDLRLPRARPAS